MEAVLIAGPTASGKSALALRLARAFGGTLVNADSMQVYADLAVLTARPRPDEVALAPHRLFGIVDGAENYSAGRYARAAAGAIRDADVAGSLPVVVGGTGLYFRALTDGLSAMPDVPDAVRQRLRSDAADRETEALHADLAKVDRAGADRLRPTDRQRVLRALEVFAATGRSLLEFHAAREPGPLAGRRLLRVFLRPDRATLRARIDARFDAMLAAGALEEVARLRERRLDPALPVMRAHGVPALLEHLAGRLSLADATARGQADTRAYAKRQLTWFRGQMPDYRPLAPDEAFAAVAGELRAGGRREVTGA